MKRAVILLVLLLVAGVSRAADDNKILVQFQIFRFASDLQHKAFIDESIWTTEETPERLKGKVIVFSKGWFKVGKDKLEFKDGRCFWQDKPMPIDGLSGVKLPADEITPVYSPSLVMKEHDSGSVKIKARQPIQYLVRREDGLFELKEVVLPTGLDIDIEQAVEEEDKGFIRLTDIIMTLRLVEKRERIPGVELPVGRPILGQQKYVFYFRLRPGKDYGILLKPQHGRGGLLIRLRACSTHSGTMPKPTRHGKEESQQKD